MEFYHEPIMLKEITEGLNISSSDIFIDCTLGGAGHSSEIIKNLENGLLIGIDKDFDAIFYASERLNNFNNKILIKNDFKNYKNIINNTFFELNNIKNNIVENKYFDINNNTKNITQKIIINNKLIDRINDKKVDKILIDLGVSSHQIDTANRGFSFRFDAPLDMRMDTSQEKSAWHIVNFYPKEKLIKILYEYGEEKFAPLIVNNIIKYRKNKTIDTTKELNNIIENCLPKKYVFKSGGCAKKTFQAIRIEVNNELEDLGNCLQDMIDSLAVGGRLAVLTFHSLEDRIVKNVFKENAIGCICPSGTPICICGHKQVIKLITKKPIVASNEEQQKNPRSTSAKLRIIEKI